MEMQLRMGGQPVSACICGHHEEDHTAERGCSRQCLCEYCPSDTANDCWCAGYSSADRPTRPPRYSVSGMDEFAAETTWNPQP